MEEEKLREIAISRYKNGESPKTIYESLGRSKAWFFKWLKRYSLEKDNWSKSKSRKPGKSPKRIDANMEQTVIQKRKELEKTLYSQIGAFPISYQLTTEGSDIPSIATVNRIIKRNNLTRKKPAYNSKGVAYPALVAKTSNYVHQFDVVGPRYLKTGRFYSANIIDACDRRASVNPVLRQTRHDIAGALILCFKTLGIPKYLQLDNKLPSRGSNRYPHSFGLVIRLCLYLGIEPVFIAIKEPWRNGIVEHFNNVFDKSFFRSQFFKSFLHLYNQAKIFEAYHNGNHRYSSLSGKTPNEFASLNLVKLPDNFTIPDPLPIYPGYIHIVRFVRSNRIIDIFGEKYSMPVEVEYEYVWVTIDTKAQTISVYHDSALIEQYSYPLPSSAIELSKIDL
jgi:transposase InsO family protein